MNKPLLCLSCLACLMLFGDAVRVTSAAPATAAETWPVVQAKAWGEKTPWLVGCNFIPSTAINELEMWQADTFDLPTIDRELGWAEQLGFNSVRVFLHNIPWEQDPKGFLDRLDRFLDVAHKHHIGATFVLFDSCWDPYPKPGKQRVPQPGLHNSGWVQCPGAALLHDRAQWGKLQSYVTGVVGHFKDDPRIHMWDVYNEPDNMNDSSYGAGNLKQEPPTKIEDTLALLQKVFAWAREAGATQPLTSAPWHEDWSDASKLSRMNRLQLDNSDVISFHVYSDLPHTRERVESLRRYNRPLICTEYMARPVGSTFEAILPYFKEQKIAAYNWGFVAGKTNTIYPWDSWQHAYATEPRIWFHDIFRADGTPFDAKEVSLIKGITGRARIATVMKRRQQLGAPFSEVSSVPIEVIDPEALLWGSLEFLPTEPRLFEAMTLWLRTHENHLIHQRLKKLAASADPRARLWHAIKEGDWSDPGELPELFHGVESQKEATEFFQRVARHTLRPLPSESRIGCQALGPATLLLRARDLLGSDVRHFILVFLLANQGGGKLRTIHEWSGYSYRSVFEAVTRWQAAGVAVIKHGYGSLSDVQPWRDLLHYRRGRITIVNWFALFDEAVRLLRVLAKARRKGFDWDNPVLIAHRRDAYKAISSPLIDGTPTDAPSVARLGELFPTEDCIRAIA